MNIYIAALVGMNETVEPHFACLPAVIMADSRDEASTITEELLEEQYPSEEGWKHAYYTGQLSELMLQNILERAVKTQAPLEEAIFTLE